MTDLTKNEVDLLKNRILVVLRFKRPLQLV